MNNDLSAVTRLEIIDHTDSKCENCHGSGKIHIAGQPQRFECPTCHGTGRYVAGRDVIFHNANKQIEAQLQDDGRTLKIFISKRGELTW